MKDRPALKIILWAALAAAPLAAQPQLKFVVIVTRHGVRAPTWDARQLNEYSAEPWPDFGVAPGELTAHGRALVQILGSYYRERFAKEHLLHAGCTDANKVYIWADTDQRTMETGRALAESILNGCRIQVHSRDGGKDPLFSGAATADPKLAAEAVRVRAGAEPEKLILDHRAALDALQRILDGGQPTARKLLTSQGKNGNDKKGSALPDALATASTLSENLLLEYSNGMKDSQLGWGRLTKDRLYQVLELHRVYADLTRRTQYLARVRGSNLLRHILASLQQAVSGMAEPGALGPPDTSLLVLSGHDTNLSNLSGMLGVSWTLAGYQPDETPPGGAIIFSLWQDRKSSQLTVRTEYLAASLDQMRSATPLTEKAPPLREALSIPGCGNASGCSWAEFDRLVRSQIDPSAVDFQVR